LTSGGYNVLTGYLAGYSLTSGQSNVCIGKSSGLNLTAVSGTIAIGAGALTTNTTSAKNTGNRILVRLHHVLGVATQYLGYRAARKCGSSR
jgi:hypothetical protein